MPCARRLAVCGSGCHIAIASARLDAQGTTLKSAFGKSGRNTCECRSATTTIRRSPFAKAALPALVRQAYKAVFIAEKGQRYRLAYGTPEVKSAPVYEQGVTAYLRRGQKAEEWRLAPAPKEKSHTGRRCARVSS